MLKIIETHICETGPAMPDEMYEFYLAGRKRSSTRSCFMIAVE
jgi:hypothetical protein